VQSARSILPWEGEIALNWNAIGRPFSVFLFAVAMTIAVSGSGTAHAGSCIKRSEIPAVEARLFQTELMIAALTCQRRQDYNRIIAKFGTELAARGRSLKAVFSRLHGSESERRLNRFVTRLANEASLRSLRKSGYCENAASLMDGAPGVVDVDQLRELGLRLLGDAGTESPKRT